MNESISHLNKKNPATDIKERVKIKNFKELKLLFPIQTKCTFSDHKKHRVKRT